MSKLFYGVLAGVGGIVSVIPPVACTAVGYTYVITGVGAAIVAFAMHRFGQKA